jgi:Xaa-Pro aminopeptidase
MDGVLIFGDTRSSDLRHEVQVGLTDLCAYAEHEGRRYLFIGEAEEERMSGMGDWEVVTLESLGANEAFAEGKSLLAAAQEAVGRGCQQVGLRKAVIPSDFPVGVAEHLRDAGVELRTEVKFFEDRRRSKKDWELAGVRRALVAAEAALAAMRERIRAPEAVDTEELRAIAGGVFAEHRCIEHEMPTFVVPGPQGAEFHAGGSGPVEPNQPILLDIFPRDLASGCWGDLSRTICKGEAPERLRRYHSEVREAQRLATEAVRPGVSACDLFRVAATYLSEKGHQTRMGKEPDEMPGEGFVHALGHGVGIDIHESPLLDGGNTEPLVPGDIVTIEPGVYYKDFGGVRIEDMVLVTDTGHEVLTRAPYDLEA